jgi:arabinofuranan 3-O-arabinosyltransferase
MGTVSHQRIGFLWPMGPWYWLADAAGLPDGVAQRLWWGTIIVAAGAGTAYLLRTLGWRPGPGSTAAVFGYGLSPVILTLVARLSGVLLPFCGLPWLIAFAVQTVRHRGWRYPALFALTAVTFGSVNATGILLVGIAPALWLVYAVVGSREATLRQAATAAARIAVPTLATSAWWIAGLNVQRTNGLEITRHSETASTVASTSLSHEVLRGLGYWFFYGRDRLGPWNANPPFPHLVQGARRGLRPLHPAPPPPRPRTRLALRDAPRPPPRLARRAAADHRRRPHPPLAPHQDLPVGMGV